MILLWTMAFWRFPHPNPSQLVLLVWSQTEKKWQNPQNERHGLIRWEISREKLKTKRKRFIWAANTPCDLQGTLDLKREFFQRLHVTHQFTDPPIRKSWRITDISNQFNSRLQTKKNAISPQIRALCNKPLEESASSISGAWRTRFPSLPSDFGNGGGGEG